MKKSVLVCMLAVLSFNAFADDVKVEKLTTEVEKLATAVKTNESSINQNAKTITQLKDELSVANQKIDSLNAANEALTTTLNEAKKELGNNIEETNATVKTNNEQIQSSVKSRTIWGLLAFVVALLAIGVTIYNIIRRMSSNNSVLDDVKKAQKNLEEESVKLDNKLVELLEKQLKTTPAPTAPQTPAQSAPDHSLALKVADEIVRIELNLSRMDPFVKGHKQLSKGVERIKDNFKAKGYEITEMLGKPYNEGMKVVANFVPDENLPEGSQIITGITKPQILFNGTMIQAAQITVSQNI